MRLMREWYDRTGFEFLGQDVVSADDPKGFIAQWKRNEEWMQDLLVEVGGIINEYRNRYE